MKTNLIRNTFISAATAALVAPVFLAAASPSSTPLGTPASSASPGRGASPALDFEQRMDRLNDRLDSVFADTFRNFDDWFGGSHFASSIDLREQKDRYVVRLYVPDSAASKVNAEVENNALHVTATNEEKENGAARSERYEQIISLPGPVESKKMKIERKHNLVVITLPKSSNALAAATPQPGPHHTAGADLAGLDQSILNRMARMQGRMEQIFRNAFPNDLTSGFNRLRLGSAVQLEDQKNQYLVRFYLPDNDLKDVQVRLENGQLHLSAAERKQTQTRGTSSLETGRYEQRFTLPGPVDEKGMKVERENGAIIVTLPKA
jgi:HSP20 family protein